MRCQVGRAPIRWCSRIHWWIRASWNASGRRRTMRPLRWKSALIRNASARCIPAMSQHASPGHGLSVGAATRLSLGGPSDTPCATRVPDTAGRCGIQRTVTAARPAADLDYLGGAKLRGMQEVMGRMPRASLDFGGSSTTDHTIGHRQRRQVGQAGTGRSRCACIPETVSTGRGWPPRWPAVMRCRH